MSDGRRPGGLTALAVINFVLGGIVALAILGFLMILGDERLLREQAMSRGTVFLLMGLMGLVATLLIVSGIGYLGMKRVLGRFVGTAYAVLALASAAVGIATQGFRLMTMVDLVYPVLTLVLLNTTFKDDLVN